MPELKRVPVYNSLIERPLPFFGAGVEVGIASAAILFVAQMFFGLISWFFLAALLLCYGMVKLTKRWRKVDSFGVESVIIGGMTPSRYVRGTRLLENAKSPKPSLPEYKNL